MNIMGKGTFAYTRVYFKAPGMAQHYAVIPECRQSTEGKTFSRAADACCFASRAADKDKGVHV